MKRHIVITAAILSGAWVSQVLAQSTQPAGEREWFVRTVRLPGKKVARQFLRYDFTTGSQIVLESSDSRYFPNIKFMDSRGRHLRLRTRDMAEDSGWGKRIELDGAEPGTPRRVFEQLKVRTWWRAALSPDGRKIVCFDSGEFSIVIGDETSVHVIPTEW